jgi:hypothetical protein
MTARRAGAAALAAALALAACSASHARSAAARTPAPSPTPPPVTVFGISPGGTPGVVSCPTWLVLASSRLAYSSDELAQIAGQVASMYADPNAVPPLIRPVAVTPINTETWQWQREHGCIIDLQVTNVTGGAVQVPEAGWRLTGPTQPDTDQFRLIDQCSTTGSNGCAPPSQGGVPLGCDRPAADVTLSPGPAGADALTEPIGLDDNQNRCPPTTLLPGQTVELRMTVRAGQPGVYRAAPVVVVATPRGRTTVEVDSLATNLAFADPKQFTCYQRRDNAFVEAVSGAAALVWNGNSSLFCV